MIAHGVRTARRPPTVAGEPWLLRYMQIPFVERGRAFEGADCRGWVLLILEHERGVYVPEPRELYASTELRDAAGLRDLVAAEAHRWRRADHEPAPPAWSVLLFGVRAPGGQLIPAHVGLALDGRRFAHTQQGYGPQMTHLDSSERGEARWGERLMGAYVYDA